MRLYLGVLSWSKFGCVNATEKTCDVVRLRADMCYEERAPTKAWGERERERGALHGSGTVEALLALCSVAES
jgi:hypothetical protein